MPRIRSPPTVGLVRLTETDAHRANVEGPPVQRIRSPPTVWLRRVTENVEYHASVQGPRMPKIRSPPTLGLISVQRPMRIMPMIRDRAGQGFVHPRQ